METDTGLSTESRPPESDVPAEVAAQADYIAKFQSVCDKYLRGIADPRGKRVLVLGVGHGTEMLWCLRNGAAEVVGVDLAPRDLRAVRLAMERLKVSSDAPLEVLQMSANDVHTLGRTFDLVLSNNVFEHLSDVRGALRSASRAVTPITGRIAIFTNPLYYSSAGSHLEVEPWEHLYRPKQMAARAPDDYMRREYESLNGMTLRSFIKAVADVNLAILQLHTVVDRNVSEIPRYRGRIASSVSTADLSVEGIQAEFMVVPGAGRPRWKQLGRWVLRRT